MPLVLELAIFSQARHSTTSSLFGRNAAFSTIRVVGEHSGTMSVISRDLVYIRCQGLHLLLMYTPPLLCITPHCFMQYVKNSFATGHRNKLPHSRCNGCYVKHVNWITILLTGRRPVPQADFQ